MGFLLISAWGEGLPLTGWEINKKWNMHEVAEAPRVASVTGFQATYANDQFEVALKGTVLPDSATAKQKASIELTNIQNLYKPHSNPYVGQVSDLIQCAPDLVPKTSFIQPAILAGVKTTLLVGGATGRKMFGACARDQIAYWGGYFQFFSEPQKMAVEVRIFHKKNTLNLQQARGKIKTLSEQLFTKAGGVP